MRNSVAQWLRIDPMDLRQLKPLTDESLQQIDKAIAVVNENAVR
jgi:hypothetical protein